MYMQDIEKRFTEKVAEYLTAGYIFSQETMRGSQGEMCKVDLKRGDSFIRIRLLGFYEIDMDGISLDVMSNEADGLADRSTVWDEDFEKVVSEKFCYASSRKNFYIAEDDYEKAHIREKRYSRYKARAKHPQQLPEKAKAIVLPYIKRMKGFKSTKLADIDVVLKVDGHYEASVRGKRVVLFQKGV